MDNNETLADILRDMRNPENDYITNNDLRDLADRIEAAAKRERNAHINDIHDALYMATLLPGNAAALREALEEQLLYWDTHIRTRDEEAMRQHIEAALAAPPRNCDRFATANDAANAWQAYSVVHRDRDYSLMAAFTWLFAPAESSNKQEGGAK